MDIGKERFEGGVKGELEIVKGEAVSRFRDLLLNRFESFNYDFLDIKETVIDFLWVKSY